MKEFKPGMKVQLPNGSKKEQGIVLDIKHEYSKGDVLYGMIRWDSKDPEDVEDWIGQYGTFVNMGGVILPDEYEFKYIK